MSQGLSDIQILRTVLGRLNAERPANVGGYLDQTHREERDGDFFQRLQLEVVSRQGKARVAVTGQIGVGKSSELQHFYRSASNDPLNYYPIFCDLEKEEHPDRCGATGVFLTILRDSWGATKQIRNRESLEFQKLREDILRNLTDWLRGTVADNGRKISFRFGGMEFPVYLGEPPEKRNQAIAVILGKAALHYAVSAPSERFGIAPDSLINLLNRLLDWFARRSSGKAPLLFVDHIDKIRDADAAREVLIEVAPQWKRLRASVIITAPFEFTLGELRNSVEAAWGKPVMLYPLEIPDPGGGPIPGIYSDIVKTSGLSKLVPDTSLRLLAFYSGGIPRTFVQFLIQGSKQAHLAGHETIEPSDARTVIQSAERDYEDYGARELALLDEIDRTGVGLREATTLLRSPIGLLVRKTSDAKQQRLQVHPLALSVLERYRLRIGRMVG